MCFLPTGLRNVPAISLNTIGLKVILLVLDETQHCRVMPGTMVHTLFSLISLLGPDFQVQYISSSGHLETGEAGSTVLKYSIFGLTWTFQNTTSQNVATV